MITESKLHAALRNELRALRKEAKLTQREFAKCIHTTRSRVTSIEQGCAPVSMTYFVHACQFFEVDHGALLQSAITEAETK